MSKELQAAVDKVLIESLSPTLVATVKRLLAAGEQPKKIIGVVRKAANGRQLAVLAVEALIDQEMSKP